MIHHLRIPIVVALLGTLCLAGCNGDRLGTVPVYGKVAFVGRETPEVCRLFFQPLEPTGAMRSSVATLGANGSYQVKAFRNSKGLLPGTYRVRVSYFDLKPGANRDLDESWIEHTYDAGELIVDARSPGMEHNIEVP